MSQEETTTEHYTFKVHGESITQQIRDFSQEPNLEFAWKTVCSLVPLNMVEENKEYLKKLLRQIIEGKARFEGINNLNLVEEECNENIWDTMEQNMSYENRSYYQERLPTYDYQCSECEDLLFEEELLPVSLHNLSAGDILPAGYCPFCNATVNKEDSYEKTDFRIEKTQLEHYKELYNISSKREESIRCRAFASKSLDHEYCWITQEGHLIPVEAQGHIPKLRELSNEAGLHYTEKIAEKIWIKVTTGRYIFSMGRKMTAKQKITLTKYLEARKDFYFKNEEVELEIIGYGYAFMENGNVKLKKGY